jgi:hypothetical protein
MRHPVLCGVLFAIAFVFAADARPIDVTVRSVAPAPNEVSEGTLVISAVVGRDAQDESRSVRMSVPGNVIVDLPDGVWRLEVKAAGWFHAGKIVTITESDTGTIIPVWPLGTIQGNFQATDKTIVRNVTARWTSSGEPGAAPEGELPCALNENEYRCPVPAGTSDVKIGAKGYASQFLWGVKVPPRGTVTAPTFPLKKGAGVYGWVAVGRGIPFDSGTTRVRLTPSMADRRPQRQPALVAAVDKRGFFAFSGIEPGAYRIFAIATDANSESEERELVIRPEHEAELLRPLVLERRVPLHVTIDPRVDPSGQPWHLFLSRTRNTYDTSAVIQQANVDDNGVATVSHLPPGAYELSVMPRGRDVAFVTRAIEMPRDASVSIEIKTTHVVGTVRMNDRPLSGAVVWVGGKFRTPAVTLITGPGGDFDGVVPFDPAETWLVTVTHSTPSMTRTIHERPERESEETVRLDLVIPAGMIDGVVVDADGSPALRGIANVIRAGDETADVMQAQIAEGKFELTGLSPGDYTVYAEGLGGRATRKSMVNVAEDQVSSVKLTFGESLRVTGRLTTDDGAPIAGAKVFVNSAEVPAPVWIPRTSGGGGEFGTELAEGTRNIDIVVIAPGFAFKFFRAPLDTERQIVILMRQNGGRLALMVPTAAMEGISDRIPFVVHNGVAIPAMFLLSNRIGRSSAGDGGLTITAPNVEPGAYGLCIATVAEAASLSQSANCSFGNLPPFGTVDLSIQSANR